MSLNDWVNEGKLKKHDSSKHEISQLFHVYSRDIKDAQAENLSVDRKFTTAYNAAMILARIALAAEGYRTTGEGNHYWVIQSLAYTLGSDLRTINTFNKFRKKRNTSDYEMVGIVSEKETYEMINLAQNLYDRLLLWLEKSHPELC